MLLLRLLLIGVLVGALLPALASPAVADDYEQVVDITFPADDRASGRYTDDFSSPRGNSCGIHRATDIMGEHGWPVYAAVGGTITVMPESRPAYGWIITIAGDDGRHYDYIHLGRDDNDRGAAYAAGLSKGDTVQRGEHIGYVGSSGNASDSAPHLHFQMRDEGLDHSVCSSGGYDYLNPYRSLRDAERRGDYARSSVVPVVDDGGDSGQDGSGEEDTAEPEPAPETATVDRVAGAHRVATAVELSATAFPSADHVVVAAAGSFADSVAAGPLAAHHGGPVLTTRGARLEDLVVDEVKRLGATRATIVGGDAAVSPEVEVDLVDKAGLRPSNIDRRAGDNRYETAVAVAEAVWAGVDKRQAGVALGDHEQDHRAWPDALTAGYRGAVTGAPVLLVTPGGIPPATAAALQGVADATVVGGTAVISEEVYAEVQAHAEEVRRLAGADRYMTAAAVAADLVERGASLTRVWAATGRTFADALAAAPAVAEAGEVLLLVDGADSGEDHRLDAWLRERAKSIDTGRVIGGPAAISEDAQRRLAERIS